MTAGLELFTYCVTGMEFPLLVPCSESFRFVAILSLGCGVRDAPCGVPGKPLPHGLQMSVRKDRVGTSAVLLFLRDVATRICSRQVGYP